MDFIIFFLGQMEEMMKKPSLILVEIVIVDRFHRAISFPYIQGAVKQAGLDCELFCYGEYAASSFSESESDAVLISDSSIEKLSKSLTSQEYSFVLFSHKMSKKIIPKIHSFLTNPTEVSYGYVMESGDPLLIHDLHTEKQIHLFQWIPLPKESKQPIDIFKLSNFDYSWNALNDNAQTHRPLPHLLLGTECVYRKPLPKEYYETLKLSNCIRTSGCTFCMTQDDQLNPVTDPFQVMEDSFEKVAQRITWNDCKPRYRITGAKCLYHLDKFTETLIKLKIPPSDFLFDCRVDDIVNRYSYIEKGIKTLSNTEHRIQFALIGIENFSQDELLRFNKGITTESIIHMVYLLQYLQASYPMHFDFKEYGGFSTILFTPWTRLLDVALNLKLILLLHIEPICGKLLYSKLRLYPQLPLYHLAEQDHLLQDTYDDPIFDTAHWNYYSSESPWMFRDKQVDLLYRIVSRIPIHSALSNDLLYSTIQDWKLSIQDRYDSDAELALLILKYIAKNVTKIFSKDTISDTITMILDGIAKEPRHNKIALQPSKQMDAVQKRAHNTEDDPIVQLLCSELSNGFLFNSHFFETGRRSVGKVDSIHKEHISLIKRWLRDAFGESLQFRELRFIPKQGPYYDLFYGFDNDALNAITDATSIQIDKKGREVSEIYAATRTIGDLLGYPACCVNTYLEQSHFDKNHDGWLLLKQRIEANDRVHKLLNPFIIGLPYIPCTLHCAETIALTQSYYTMLGKKHPTQWDTINKVISKPVFYLLEDHTTFCILNPKNETESGFEYDILRIVGNRDALEPLIHSNRLHISKGVITLFSEDEELYSYILEAWIWWDQKLYDSEFWKTMVTTLSYMYAFKDAIHTSNSLAINSNSAFPHEETDFSVGSITDTLFTVIFKIVSYHQKSLIKNTEYSIKNISHVHQRVAISFNRFSRNGLDINGLDIKGSDINGSDINGSDIKSSDTRKDLCFIIDLSENDPPHFMKGTYFSLSYTNSAPIEHDKDKQLAIRLLYILEKYGKEIVEL